MLCCFNHRRAGSPSGPCSPSYLCSLGSCPHPAPGDRLRPQLARSPGEVPWGAHVGGGEETHARSEPHEEEKRKGGQGSTQAESPEGRKASGTTRRRSRVTSPGLSPHSNNGLVKVRAASRRGQDAGSAITGVTPAGSTHKGRAAGETWISTGTGGHPLSARGLSLTSRRPPKGSPSLAPGPESRGYRSAGRWPRHRGHSGSPSPGGLGSGSRESGRFPISLGPPLKQHLQLTSKGSSSPARWGAEGDRCGRPGSCAGVESARPLQRWGD